MKLIEPQGEDDLRAIWGPHAQGLVCPGCGYGANTTEHQIICVEGRTDFTLKKVTETQGGIPVTTLEASHE